MIIGFCFIIFEYLEWAIKYFKELCNTSMAICEILCIMHLWSTNL